MLTDQDPVPFAMGLLGVGKLGKTCHFTTLQSVPRPRGPTSSNCVYSTVYKKFAVFQTMACNELPLEWEVVQGLGFHLRADVNLRTHPPGRGGAQNWKGESVLTSGWVDPGNLSFAWQGPLGLILSLTTLQESTWNRLGGPPGTWSTWGQYITPRRGGIRANGGTGNTNSLELWICYQARS